jgi:hypothetical protein
MDVGLQHVRLQTVVTQIEANFVVPDIRLEPPDTGGEERRILVHAE